MAAPSPTPVFTPPQTCRYVYDPVTRCQNQRPCDSCLAKRGCMVDLIGACQPLAVKADDPWHYARAIDRNQTLPSLKDSTNTSAIREVQEWYFPSVTTTYCSTDDAVCKQCIQARFWLPAGVEHDNRFCVGASGCVCIDNCEFNQNVLEQICPRSPVPTLYTDDTYVSASTAPPWTRFPLATTPGPSSAPSVRDKAATATTAGDVVLVIALSVFGVVCIVGVLGWCRRRRRRRDHVHSVPMAIPIPMDNDDDRFELPSSLPADAYHPSR